MPPTKRSPSRGRTPTRNTARRIDSYPTPTSTNRGRSLSITTSRSRSTSMGRLTRGRRSVSGVYAASQPKSTARLRTSRMSKKYRKRTAVMNGTTTVYECGGVVNSGTTGEILYIGHGFPVWTMLESAWWTVLRLLFIKAGVSVASAIPANALSVLDLRNGDAISVRYRNTGASALSIQTYTVVTSDTVNTVIAFFASNSQWSTLTTGNQVEFFDLQYVPNIVITSPVGRAVIKLDNCILDFDVKCDLKLQNRTLAASNDDQSDDVNNVPIYGKSYEGPGTGPSLIGYEAGSGIFSGTFSFRANMNTGIIIVTPSGSSTGTDSAIREPLDYQLFKPLKKCGKIHLDAGQIKTSTIQKKFKVQFNKFMNTVYPDQAEASVTVSGTRQVNGNLSMYRMFALEKMIDAQTLTTPSDTRTAVIVAIENNNRIFITARPKQSNPTLVRFLKTYLA